MSCFRWGKDGFLRLSYRILKLLRKCSIRQTTGPRTHTRTWAGKNELDAETVNKIQKLVDVTLGRYVVEKLATDLSVWMTVEDLLYVIITETGKSVEEVAEMDLTYDDIKEIYQQSREYKALPVVLATVEIPETIIPEDTERAIIEQQVRHRGEVWVIHRNDADPFPSAPHAHNYEANLRLHLGTGNLYLKKRIVGKIDRKALTAIREQISHHSLPELVA